MYIKSYTCEIYVTGEINMFMYLLIICLVVCRTRVLIIMYKVIHEYDCLFIEIVNLYKIIYNNNTNKKLLI